MLKRDEHKEFLEKIFQQVDDLEAESSQYPIRTAIRDYGLTMAEATRAYYKRGMTGKQFLDAIKADREK